MEEAAGYIALAIPVFFLLIGVELLIAKLKRTRLYSFSDALTNISCGIGQQVSGVFLKTILLVGYIYLYENHALLELSGDKWWVWVLLFVGVDFFYYWFHRYAHEISLMWGGHIVHHQSEEYNLSVALRQGAFQGLFSWIFYLPLAVIGFDPITFVIVNQFQTLYQFWIHTKAIDRMPRWFEFIFNTPSHHRVHHGVNPKYIDKNHGGTLIIFDRMFGTFQAEEEEVVYGITKPLASWNPVWANLAYFRDVFKLAFRTRNVGDFFKVFTKPPGWQPEYLGGPLKPGPVSSQTFSKFQVQIPRGLNYYVLFQYALVLAGTTVFLFKSGELLKTYGSQIGMLWQLGLAAMIILSIMTLGGLLEKRRWALFTEIARLLVITATVPNLFWETSWLLYLVLGLGVITVFSLVWLLSFLFAFQKEVAV